MRAVLICDFFMQLYMRIFTRVIFSFLSLRVSVYL